MELWLIDAHITNYLSLSYCLFLALNHLLRPNEHRCIGSAFAYLVILPVYATDSDSSRICAQQSVDIK